ncbi:hypothetical protein [uncultured Corynebacterium sp.]|uniref:hypothetical protein n=1 Tax=uncultured Corynebacterium sp. TaxID=159447 RepID=UPI0025E4C0A5|nr:hypothetical protein [uncultured Corynebacterium sp.]
MFVKLDPENQMKAANAEVVRVVEAVNPELLDSLDMAGPWIKQLKARCRRPTLISSAGCSGLNQTRSQDNNPW